MATGTQSRAAVSGLSDGGFVVTWTDREGLDGDNYGVFGQIYDASGQLVGDQFQVTSHVTGIQGYSSTIALDDGGFVAVWTGRGGQDGSGDGVFGQRFTADGEKIGAEFLVNQYTGGDQRTNTSCLLYTSPSPRDA